MSIHTIVYSKYSYFNKVSNFTIVVICCILFQILSYAQSDSDHVRSHNYYDSKRKERKMKFRKTIRDLENGTLILKLRNNKTKIDYYNSIGEFEKAKAEKKEWDKINKHLVDSFKKYNYSDFKVTYGYLIKEQEEGKREHIFLNEDLEIDSTIKANDGPVLYTQMRGKAYQLRFYYDDHTLVETPLDFSLISSDSNNQSAIGDTRSASTLEFFNFLVASDSVGQMLNFRFKRQKKKADRRYKN